MDNSLHNSQAYAGALKLRASVQSPENTEYPVNNGHIKTDSVITNEIGYPAVGLWGDAEFDSGKGAIDSELGGIAKQIFQYLLH
jgi:hypothetical protein